jgi:hypothetical protein
MRADYALRWHLWCFVSMHLYAWMQDDTRFAQHASNHPCTT